MSGKVKLEVTEGPMKGKEFLFEEHNTFIGGRMPDCHLCLPHDPMVSRNHFILEANPPDARIRDLGSLNGTFVNGDKCGQREARETPEEGAKRAYPDVDLKDGDRIQAGASVLAVHIEVPAICNLCKHSIADQDRAKCVWTDGAFICTSCKAKLAASVNPVVAPKAARCQKCGKDVSGEIGQGRVGDYVCQACRQKAQAAPDLMLQMIRQILGAGEATPEIQGYEIEKELGRGGMGVVYLARRKTDNQRVALKVMLSETAVDEDSRSRFLRECEISEQLESPRIVKIHEKGSSGIAFFLTMEYCNGGDIASLMHRRGGKLSLSEAGPIMLQALEGLDYAQNAVVCVTNKDGTKVKARGVVHRDLKPPNILLTGTEGHWQAKVSDYGLAKAWQTAGRSGYTLPGAYAGSYAFMPPEQPIAFLEFKPAGDVWSMAATFYNMLTGSLPRDFPKATDAVAVVMHGEIIPIRRRDPTVPGAVAEVIDRALSRAVKDRYQTAAEMKKALEAALQLP